MQIGIVGRGNTGWAFAGHLVRGGHDVVLSKSSGPDSLSDVAAPVPGPGEATSSEVIAVRARGARVVKTGNHMGAADLAAGASRADGNVVLYFSGDDVEAKEVLTGVFEGLDFIVVDLGPLGSGSRLQQFPGGPLAGRAFVTLPL